jgi:hypothetical protein
MCFVLVSSAATGTVHIEIVKDGFIVDVGGGRGTLVFQGRRYTLRVGGLSFGATIGRPGRASPQFETGIRDRRHFY